MDYSDSFDIALKAFQREGKSKDIALRSHLKQLTLHQNELLEKFKNQSEFDEIESFMLAALEDSDEHNLSNLNSNYSLIPNNVIEDFLSDDENE